MKRDCLVYQRTGKCCHTCQGGNRHATRYANLRARGICARCVRRKSTRGVLCTSCYDHESKRHKERRRAAGPVPARMLRCGECLELGHMAKTCLDAVAGSRRGDGAA